MTDQDSELPEFPEGIPTSIGDELATDGAQNICLSSCIYWWNGIRWVPWQPMTFCGPSMEEIQRLADFWLQKLADLGFQCRAQQGGCPSS